MQPIGIAKHCSRPEHIQCPDRWHSDNHYMASASNYGAIIAFTMFGSGLRVSSQVLSYGSPELGKRRDRTFLGINRGD